MRVLGIDAAWTYGEPSGVALVEETNASKWKCLGVAPSYDAFTSLANGRLIEWHSTYFNGSTPDGDQVLQASVLLSGSEPDVITVDMPVSKVEITDRRPADNAISVAFGRYQAGTHSPSSQRPGVIGSQLSNSLAVRGFPLATTSTTTGSPSRLVEVYPHPSLIRLMDADRRLPYKQGNSTKYWPGTDVRTRIGKLLDIYRAILEGLARSISDINLRLPAPDDVPSLAHLKRYEDAIDALVCAWTGIEYLGGRAEPFGDINAAIWVPV